MSETRMMSFLEHLGDLRKKITVSLIAMCVMFIVTFNYSEYLLEFSCSRSVIPSNFQ